MRGGPWDLYGMTPEEWAARVSEDTLETLAVARSNARAAAIEECAKVAEGAPYFYYDIATDIRALAAPTTEAEPPCICEHSYDGLHRPDCPRKPKGEEPKK